MLHTVIDLDEVFKDPGTNDPVEGVQKDIKNAIAADTMRYLHFNGN